MRKLIKIFMVFTIFCLGGQIADASTSLEIDFTINQEINMVGHVDSRDLDIDPLVVRNNNDLYEIQITKITAEPMNGWEIIDGNANFETIQPNSKKLSISTTDGDELCDEEVVPVRIAPKVDKEIGLLGKMCMTFPSDEKTQIAKIVVEVEPVLDAETVLYYDGTFIINELSYKREENKRKHAGVKKTYPAWSEENSYVAPDSNSMLWKSEAAYIKKVEIGSHIKPISTAYWFFNCYNLERFDSTYLDMSECTSTYMMFFCAGKNVITTFELIGLDDWDVSKVTTFDGMFNQAGYGAKDWNIGDLSGWQTNSVESISNMFYRTGFNANVWDIGDIGKWDVSNVRHFNSAFEYCGYYSTTWNIGDLSNWVTDSAIDMTNMFYSSGYNSAEWSIGDLSKWNISNVTSFECMFKNTGRAAKEISIGNINWDLSSASSIKDMFYGFGYNSEKANIGTITISNNNNSDNAFRSVQNLIAQIKVKDYINSNSRIMQATATGVNGNVQLIPLSEDALNWCNEMVAQYGLDGSKSKGNIWI